MQLQNKFFGAVRIRQVRVRNDSCTAVPQYAPSAPNFDVACYDEYADTRKDTRPFGPGNMFQYQTCEQMGGGLSYSAKRLRYECGGYAVLIPSRTSFESANNTVYSLRVCNNL